MGTPYMGEIKIVSFNFAPQGWAFANGQFLPINQNQALFSLFGVTYGGNGQTTFALPNLQGRTPIHFGNGFTQGEAGGEVAHTLNVSELPAHNHFPMAASGAASQGDPTNAFWASGGQSIYYNPPPAGTAAVMFPGTIGNLGGSQAHQNLSPYLGLNFIVALQGAFPSRN